MNKFLIATFAALVVAQVCLCAPTSSTTETSQDSKERAHTLELAIPSHAASHDEDESTDQAAKRIQQTRTTNQAGNLASSGYQATRNSQPSRPSLAAVENQQTAETAQAARTNPASGSNNYGSNQAHQQQQAAGHDHGYLPGRRTHVNTANKDENSAHPVYVVHPANVQEPLLGARASTSTTERSSSSSQ